MAQFEQNPVVVADSQAPQIMGSAESPVIVDDTHGLTFSTGAAGGEIFLGAVGAGGFRYEGGGGRDVLHLAGDIDAGDLGHVSFSGVDVLDVNGHVLTVRQNAFDSYHFDVVGAEAGPDGAPAGGLAIVLSGRDLDLSRLDMDAATRPSLTLIQDERMDFRAGGATITLNDGVDETIQVKDLFKFSKVITLKNFQGGDGDRLIFNGDAPTDLISPAASGAEVFTNGSAEIRGLATLEDRLDALARLVTENGSAGSFAVYKDGTDTYIVALADGAEQAQVVRLLGTDYDMADIRQGIGALQPEPEPAPDPAPGRDPFWDAFWNSFWSNGGGAGNGGGSTPPAPAEPTDFYIDPVPDDGSDGLSRPDDDRNLTVTVGADDDTGLSVGDRGELEITLGDGDNVVNLEGGIGNEAHVDITVGDGHNEVTVTGGIGDRTEVNFTAGDGGNDLTVTDGIGDGSTLNVTTGAGNDTVKVGGVSGGSTLNVELGGGTNHVAIGDIDGTISATLPDEWDGIGGKTSTVSVSGSDADSLNYIDIGNVMRGAVLHAYGSDGRDYMTIQSLKLNSAIGHLETGRAEDWIIIGQSGGDVTDVEGVTASSQDGNDHLVLKGTISTNKVGGSKRGFTFDGGNDDDELQLADGCTVDGILQLFGGNGDDRFILGDGAPTLHKNPEDPTKGEPITITEHARLTIYGGTGGSLTNPGNGLSTPHTDAGNDTLLVLSDVDASQASTFKVHGIETVDVSHGATLTAKGDTFNDNGPTKLKGDGLTIEVSAGDTVNLSNFTADGIGAGITVNVNGVASTTGTGATNVITLSGKTAGITEDLYIDGLNATSGYKGNITTIENFTSSDKIYLTTDQNRTILTNQPVERFDAKSSTNVGAAVTAYATSYKRTQDSSTAGTEYKLVAIEYTAGSETRTCVAIYSVTTRDGKEGWDAVQVGGGTDYAVDLKGTFTDAEVNAFVNSFVFDSPATTGFSLFSLGPDPDVDPAAAGAPAPMLMSLAVAPMAMLLDDEGPTFGAAFEEGAAPTEEISALMADLVEAVVEAAAAEDSADPAEAGAPAEVMTAFTADDLPSALDALIEAIVSATADQAADAPAETIVSDPVVDAPVEIFVSEAGAAEASAPAVVDDVVVSEAPAAPAPDSGMDFQMDEAVLSGIDVLPDMTDLGA